MIKGFPNKVKPPLRIQSETPSLYKIPDKLWGSKEFTFIFNKWRAHFGFNCRQFRRKLPFYVARFANGLDRKGFQQPTFGTAARLLHFEVLTGNWFRYPEPNLPGLKINTPISTE